MSAAGPAAGEIVRGDDALAGRLVEELGVRTSAAAASDAGWGEYLSHLSGQALRAVAELFLGALRAVPLAPGWPRVLALAALGAALLVLGIVLVRALRNRRRKRRAAEAGSPEVLVTDDRGGRDAARERDAAAWRRELDALLTAGRIGAAIRATWWWLARSLAGDGADPSWTGRELLARSGRQDLLPLVRRLERFTYGDRAPAEAELRRLVDDAASELAARGAGA